MWDRPLLWTRKLFPRAGMRKIVSQVQFLAFYCLQFFLSVYLSIYVSVHIPALLRYNWHGFLLFILKSCVLLPGQQAYSWSAGPGKKVVFVFFSNSQRYISDDLGLPSRIQNTEEIFLNDKLDYYKKLHSLSQEFINKVKRLCYKSFKI